MIFKNKSGCTLESLWFCLVLHARMLGWGFVSIIIIKQDGFTCWITESTVLSKFETVCTNFQTVVKIVNHKNVFIVTVRIYMSIKEILPLCHLWGIWQQSKFKRIDRNCLGSTEKWKNRTIYRHWVMKADYAKSWVNGYYVWNHWHYFKKKRFYIQSSTIHTYI